MSPAALRKRSPRGGYPRLIMSESELSVICKNCGSEVSPYVTECPYCGARLRKRAPKLERRGDALEAKPSRTRRSWTIRLKRSRAAATPTRPYATLAAIIAPAALLLAREAAGSGLNAYGGLIVPIFDQWWRKARPKILTCWRFS